MRAGSVQDQVLAEQRAYDSPLGRFADPSLLVWSAAIPAVGDILALWRLP
jgi:hypothetical protein